MDGVERRIHAAIREGSRRLQPSEETPVEEVRRIRDVDAAVVVEVPRVETRGAAPVEKETAQKRDGVADVEQSVEIDIPPAERALLAAHLTSKGTEVDAGIRGIRDTVEDGSTRKPHAVRERDWRANAPVTRLGPRDETQTEHFVPSGGKRIAPLRVDPPDDQRPVISFGQVAGDRGREIADDGRGA